MGYSVLVLCEARVNHVNDEYGAMPSILRLFLPLDRRIEEVAQAAKEALEKGRERKLMRLGKRLAKLVERKASKDPAWEIPDHIFELLDEAGILASIVGDESFGALDADAMLWREGAPDSVELDVHGGLGFVLDDIGRDVSSLFDSEV